MSSSKSTVLDNLATIFAPLAGATPNVKVFPDTVKSSTGFFFWPDILTDNKWTLDGELDKVNAWVEPSPVNVSVDVTAGWFNLFDIANALTLCKSITGDKLAFD